MHLIPLARFIKRQTPTELATHTHVASYVGMQLKFDTHMTRAILILTSTSSNKTLRFGGGRDICSSPPLPPALTAQLPYLAIAVLAVWVVCGSLMLRAREGLKGGEKERRHCALALLRPPASSRVLFNCTFAACSCATSCSSLF